MVSKSIGLISIVRLFPACLGFAPGSCGLLAEEWTSEPATISEKETAERRMADFGERVGGEADFPIVSSAEVFKDSS